MVKDGEMKMRYEMKCEIVRLIDREEEYEEKYDFKEKDH